MTGAGGPRDRASGPTREPSGDGGALALLVARLSCPRSGHPVTFDVVAETHAVNVLFAGDPTRETAAAAGIAVDVVPDTADFEALAAAVVEEAAPSYHGE